MLTHTLPQLNQSQPLQVSSAMTVQGLAPLIPNLAALPATMMTSMPHMILPFSSPMISTPKPDAAIQTTSVGPDLSLPMGSQEYDDFQATLSTGQV